MNIIQQQSNLLDGRVGNVENLTQQILQQMNEMQQQIVQFHQQNQQAQQAVLAAIAAQQNLPVDEKNKIYRLLNKSVGVDDPLSALRNQLGAAAPHFPATKTAFSSYTVQQLNGLLHFYGLPGNGQKPVKWARLAEFFGL